MSVTYNAGRYNFNLEQAAQQYKNYNNAKYGGVTYNQDTSIYSSAGYNTNLNSNYVSEKGNTCTDGKDDGKVGFWNAAGNVVQGVGKGFVNMIKGAFTNSEGKFSIWKTLGTVATAAVCIAFPAVGLVACGLGAVVGAVKIGTGVYNALNTNSDAEAKDAWEQVGEGALTLGLSIAGAKASYGAMQSSISAAGETSAVGQLGKDATMLQKGGALLKDMKTSTKVSFKNIGSGVNTLKSSAQTKGDAKKLIDIEKQLSEGDLSDSQIWKLESEKQAINTANPNAAAKAEAMKSAESLRIEKWNTAKAQAKTKVTDIGKRALDTGKKALDSVKHPFRSTRNIAKNTYNTIKNSSTKEFGKNIISNTSKAYTNISSRISNIANQLKDGNMSYNQAIKEFGYTDVVEAMKVIGAQRQVDESL